MRPRNEFAERLKQLPPYLFSEIDRKKKAARAAGRDVIDLGVGDPDTPTPDFVIEALARAARDPATHRYALDEGDALFRETAAAWFAKRYGVRLDPATEIYPTLGSKEALGHLPLALVDPDERCLVPEPGYPPYRSGAVFAGAEVVPVDLLPENGFFPDFSRIAQADADAARILFLNYPNSPTGVLATEEFYAGAVAFAKRHEILIAQDAAYAEMVFEGKARSIFETPGAKECALEFHSLSKTFNMTGWRIGFVAGASELIRPLARVKANLDSGVFTAVQRAGAEALRRYDEFVPGLVEMYRKRRDVFCAALTKAGWKVTPPAATFYVWFPTPQGLGSAEAAGRILEEADVVLTPGAGFSRPGGPGEGFLRVALTVGEERLAEAAARIARLKW